MEKHEWFFESIALISFIVTMGFLALPVMGDIINPQEPNEIVVHMYVEDYLGFDPDEIVVKKGETVKLVLISMDVGHSLIIPELGIDTGTILPGEKKVIEFTPQEAGVYTFKCNTECSSIHHFMRGKLIVEG
ncbi:MAG: cupredoxin domain-containing protein [Nitrososphaerales archaeon]